MKYLQRISILYLTFPFLLFTFGWLRLSIAIPIFLIILFTLYQLLKQSPREASNLESSIANYQLPTIAYCLLLTGTWIFLSGVGGYAFQNWDHHWRNAVFHDLINFDWPVYYTQPESGPVNMLVYYVGYWLPAVWIGKLFGWQIANFFLFLWTWLGVVLVALHLGTILKTSPVKSILLLIFFSGLDVIGVLFFSQEYPTIFPPVTHLEIWSGNLQYSSFTTQLFWVFNQAVPAWLCIVVIASYSWSSSHEVAYRDHGAKQSPTTQIFIWSLCFFFAPLASIGLLPYLLLEIFKKINFKDVFKNINLTLLASILIFLLSYFFFSSNTAAHERGLQSIPIKDFILFFLFEGGVLWLLLAPLKWRDPRWIITGVLLLIIPFIQIGTGRDFVMRASIAPLFYLMIMVGESLFQQNISRLLRVTLCVLLFIGALTPLYEINRSVYRTYEYYFVLDESERVIPSSEPATHLESAGALENEHPGSLVADDILSLEFMDDQLSRNFIANVRQSLYYKYLAPH
jgi:hypothetical protein